MSALLSKELVENNALSNARNIRYRFTQQDSLLTFDYLLIGVDDDLWHDETIYLTLKLPLNSTVIIDQKLDNTIDIQSLEFHDCKRNNKPNNKNANQAIFKINDNGIGCLVDPVVVNNRKRTRAIIDSLRQFSEDTHQNAKQRRYKTIDSLEETLR